MTDSSYQIRVLKQLLSLIAKEESGSRDRSSKEAQESYAASAKELWSTLSGLAGKGKGELIQIIGREIGLATAAVLKEPLAQLLKDRKLQVTIEFVPVKNEKEKSAKSKRSSPSKTTQNSSSRRR